ncbi:MAG: 3-deoxy-7-phosphoheptulonate synthase [Balneolaceae bacterium]|nr:3-deoxy-7-phosphoheptulonate synthase [Balneolaceae bacterium]
MGGAKGLHEGELHRNYETYCDPRLNYEQSLEMAFLLAKEWNESYKRK